MYENIFMIVAMTGQTNAIGLNGDMLYHLKEDLKYFKETTLNNTIVCGRKTYFSFPKRPLPNRKNIILTRSDSQFEGAYTLNSKEDVLEYAKLNPNEKIFICGGDSVYSQFMDTASKLYVTVIDENESVESDSYFPNIDKNIWKVESESEYICPENAPRYRYLIYKRI